MCVCGLGEKAGRGPVVDERCACLTWSREPLSYLLIELLQYSLGPRQAEKVAKHFEQLIQFGRDALQLPFIEGLCLAEHSMP